MTFEAIKGAQMVSEGEFGNGTNNNSPVPVSVSGLTSGVGALSIGTLRTCAVVNSGVRCWGYNNQGQLGTNTTEANPLQ